MRRGAGEAGLGLNLLVEFEPPGGCYGSGESRCPLLGLMHGKRKPRESGSREAVLDDLSGLKRKGPAASHVEDQVGWLRNQQESVEWRVEGEGEGEGGGG